jgi:Flp pilus assembly protein TadG
VEFALVLPLLILLLGGVLELGRLFFAYVAVTDAAAEGATYASIYPSSSIGEITDRAQTATGGLVQLDPSMIRVERPSLTAGSPITVTVTYPFRLVTPLLGDLIPGRTIPLQATTVGVVLSSP